MKYNYVYIESCIVGAICFNKVKYSLLYVFTGAEDLYTIISVTLAMDSVIFKCPSDADGRQCGKVWDYTLIRNAAGLTSDERRQIENRMSEISLAKQESRQCPNCNMRFVNERGGRHVCCASCGFKFCWNCLQDWHPTGQDGCY